MNNQRDDLMSKIEKLLSDLKAKSDEYDRVNDEKRRLVDDLNKQLEEFKKRYSDQVGGKESVINDLNNELNALKAKVLSTSISSLLSSSSPLLLLL